MHQDGLAIEMKISEGGNGRHITKALPRGVVSTAKLKRFRSSDLITVQELFAVAQQFISGALSMRG